MSREDEVNTERFPCSIAPGPHTTRCCSVNLAPLPKVGARSVLASSRSLGAQNLEHGVTADGRDDRLSPNRHDDGVWSS